MTFGLNIRKASDFVYPAMVDGSLLSNHYSANFIGCWAAMVGIFLVWLSGKLPMVLFVTTDRVSSPWPLQRLFFFFASFFDLSNLLRWRLLDFMLQQWMKTSVENRNFFRHVFIALPPRWACFHFICGHYADLLEPLRRMSFSVVAAMVEKVPHL